MKGLTSTTPWGSNPGGADIIADIARMMDSIPPPPFFASWSLLPADRALRFTVSRRDYIGAHPDFWKNLPAERRDGPAPLFAVEIVDLDLAANAGRLAEFTAALAKAGPSPLIPQGLI